VPEVIRSTHLAPLPPRCLRPDASIYFLAPSRLRTRIPEERFGYQRTDEIFVAACVEKRHVEDQNVLLSRQNASLLPKIFVVAPQPVYARDAELVAGAQFLHQFPVALAVEVLAGLLIHIDAVFRDAALRHGDKLAVLVLVGAGYADVAVDFFHKTLLLC